MQSVSTNRLRRFETRSGHANVEIEGVAYHSPYDPIREAKSFYEGLQLEEADVILHFGWGLGYSGGYLRERLKPDARVFVLEPDADVFGLFRAEGEHREVLEDSRFQYVVGSHVSQFIDDWGLDGCQDTDRILWIGWPRADQIYGELSALVQSSFNTRLRDRAGNLLTHFERGRTYFENAASNLKYASDPTVGNLFGSFRGVPLILVSAGPSLDRNIRELRGLEQRCFILAVDTALRPLLTVGVQPHAVIVADPSELNAKHVVGAMQPDTYLIAERATHPLAMQSSSRRFQFSTGVYPDSLYREFGQEHTTLDVWGSVATAALDLACRMDADPIIFVGQDFSYTWGKAYASNTIFQGKFFDIDSLDRKETDVWGRNAPTTENLIAYRDSFLRRMAGEKGRRFVNATEGGILTGWSGLETLSLRDAVHQCVRKPLDVPARIASLFGPSKTDAAELSNHLLSVLDGPSDCDCLDGFLDLVAKKALLEDDSQSIEESIQWGIQTLRNRG